MGIFPSLRHAWVHCARVCAGRLVVLLVLSCCMGVISARSQDTGGESADANPESSLTPTRDYAIPGLPPWLAEKAQISSHNYSINFGAVMLVDYTAFSQDAISLGQVGRQQNQWDGRSLRPWMSGTLGEERQVRYLVAAEYGGFAGATGPSWALTDLELSFPIGSESTRLSLGKLKETFAYEMVGDAANLPQQERVLNPFFVGRNVGIRLRHVIGVEQKATVSMGVFDNWLSADQSLPNIGTDITGRLTRLVWAPAGGTRYLHLGVSGRYINADKESLRYRGRPESNVADYYVDTGEVAADHALHLGLESLWVSGGFSVLAEYSRALVDAPAAGNPTFSGYYVTGSWVLTGESRPYDRTVGYSRRVTPTGYWGAPELVLRFSHVDLSDEAVQGGSYDKTYLGINLWASREWKLGLGWGRTLLTRSGQTGRTDSLLMRVQWIF